jgi:hypothetical protein
MLGLVVGGVNVPSVTNAQATASRASSTAGAAGARGAVALPGIDGRAAAQAADLHVRPRGGADARDDLIDRQVGFTASMSAAAPLTIGVAKLVPA